ncbi:Mucolipin-1 [Eumeta japonica]|uniref:Mucolipin-1 n=1 Tax=Eumeta variegata TaxID=151549 RepID=A0A4C1TNT7_EUMVA|nr:Mucolipin-1 [Eumeta japonica]
MISSVEDNTYSETEDERNSEATVNNYVNENDPRQPSTFNSQMEEKMRRKLQFFFMNPIEKWKAKPLVKATLSFSLKTVNLRAAGPVSPPDCYRFDIQIILDNQDHDGQMSLDLEAEPVKLLCKDKCESNSSTMSSCTNV